MLTIAFPSELLPEKTQFELLSLDEICSAPARAGIAWWRSMRGDRLYPNYADLKPRDIAGLMQYMSLVKVIGDGADFENGFVGDAVVRAHEVPIARRKFSEVAKDMPVLMAAVTPLFRQVVQNGLALAYRGKTGHDLEHVLYTDFEGVLLPLGADGTVSHIAYVGSCTLNPDG